MAKWHNVEELHNMFVSMTEKHWTKAKPYSWRRCVQAIATQEHTGAELVEFRPEIILIVRPEIDPYSRWEFKTNALIDAYRAVNDGVSDAPFAPCTMPLTGGRRLVNFYKQLRYVARPPYVAKTDRTPTYSRIRMGDEIVEAAPNVRSITL